MVHYCCSRDTSDFGLSKEEFGPVSTDCLVRAQQQNRCLCLGWVEIREIPRDVVKRSNTFISLWCASFHPIPLPRRNIPPPAPLPDKGSGTPCLHMHLLQFLHLNYCSQAKKKTTQRKTLIPVIMALPPEQSPEILPILPDAPTGWSVESFTSS